MVYISVQDSIEKKLQENDLQPNTLEELNANILELANSTEHPLFTVDFCQYVHEKFLWESLFPTEKHCFPGSEPQMFAPLATCFTKETNAKQQTPTPLRRLNAQASELQHTPPQSSRTQSMNANTSEFQLGSTVSVINPMPAKSVDRTSSLIKPEYAWAVSLPESIKDVQRLIIGKEKKLHADALSKHFEVQILLKREVSGRGYKYGLVVEPFVNDDKSAPEVIAKCGKASIFLQDWTVSMKGLPASEQVTLTEWLARYVAREKLQTRVKVGNKQSRPPKVNGERPMTTHFLANHNGSPQERNKRPQLNPLAQNFTSFEAHSAKENKVTRHHVLPKADQGNVDSDIDLIDFSD